MSGWKGKTRGGLLGYRIFVYIIKFPGINFAYLLLRFVASYYFLFARKSNQHIYFYFRKIQGFGKLKSVFSIYKNYYALGQILIDKITVRAGFANKFTFNFDDEYYLLDFSCHLGLISAHVGNWDMAAHFFNNLDKRFNILLFDDEHQKIKKYLDNVLKEKKFNVIVIKDDLSHIIAIKNALDNKEFITVHGDRFIEGSKTIPMKFMGQTAHFPEGPFYLAARFGVPVSFVFVMKHSRKHYHFYATPPKSYLPPSRKIDREFLKTILLDYISALEKTVKKYPKQWFNYYQFWQNNDSKALK